MQDSINLILYSLLTRALEPFKLSFLSLEPLSYIVAPVREIRNIFTSSSTNMIPTQDSVLPTVYQANNIGMDILKEQSPDNYDEIRERMLSYT